MAEQNRKLEAEREGKNRKLEAEREGKNRKLEAEREEILNNLSKLAEKRNNLVEIKIKGK